MVRLLKIIQIKIKVAVESNHNVVFECISEMDTTLYMFICI